MTCEKLFNTIRDGAWHNIDDLARQLEIQKDKLIESARFLSDQGIVQYQENTQRIKIEPKWKIILPEEIETKQK